MPAPGQHAPLRPGRISRPASSLATGRRPAPLPSTSSRALGGSTSSSARSPPLPSSLASSQSSTFTQQSSSQHSPKDAEGNINVGLSPESTAQPVASVLPTRGPSVTLIPPDSSSTTQQKTYNFGARPNPRDEGKPLGNVFGPEADQGMVYKDVAEPILKQVLQGYNCTIFAYGQTGTGKTYTMEGDLTPNFGTFSPSAGIIPRTLYALFDRLASDGAEFSVKCSFVELYNEELRDLNALEYVEPPVQPMDRGVGKVARETEGGLRIYDDSKSGVVIVGLEETLISCAEDGLKVLKRGSERRQIAATKCNERSSRSHSIFTLTVHLKETSKLPSGGSGEELLKVGKLNLVDLAGSENVGRSGAEKGRAREAGMINASLLALGRVINKLVEKEKHIPYRESKLTRLLQDSLGGRTRTTIIATISPVNFEETISTLDYALRAKSIENRPEVNQRMTKSALLSQYTNEIERLKVDLLAAREKNGMYFSTASWEMMASEQEARRLALEDATKQVEIFESQLESHKMMFEQNVRLLGTKEDELKSAKKGLKKVKVELEGVRGELGDVRKVAREEKVLREAFEKSRKEWKGEAEKARGVSEELWSKLERKELVEMTNRAVLQSTRQGFEAGTTQLSTRLVELEASHAKFVNTLQTRLSDFGEQQSLELSSNTAFVKERLDELSAQSLSLLSRAGEIDQHGFAFLDLVEKTRAELVEAVESESEKASQRRRIESQKMLAELREVENVTTLAIEGLVEPVRRLQVNGVKVLEQDREILEKVKEDDRAALEQENAVLRNLVQQLTATLEQRRKEAEEEDAALVALLAEKLKAKSMKSLDKLEQSIDLVKAGASAVVSAAEARGVVRGEMLGEIERHGRETIRSVEEAGGRMEESVEEIRQGLGASMDVVRQAVTSSQQAEEVSSASHTSTVHQFAFALQSGSTTFRTDASTSYAAFEEEFSHTLGDAHNAFTTCGTEFAKLDQDIQDLSADIQNDLQNHSTTTNAFLADSTDQLSTLRNDMRTQLEINFRRDAPTGQTPRKREWSSEAPEISVDLDGERSQVVRTLLGLDASVEEVAGVVEGEGGARIEVLVPVVQMPPPMPPVRVLGEKDLNARRRTDVSMGGLKK
ncbi:kinesin family member 11 [Pseudohyphozyma bogoriensis]|nr:kinesin family member 11 [Pseudohyphozyma bogoriensis]